MTPHLRPSPTLPAFPASDEILARLRSHGAGLGVPHEFGAPDAAEPCHGPPAWAESGASAGTSPVSFLRVRFDRLSEEALMGRLLCATQDRAFSYLVTPNVDHLLRIRRNPEIAELYRCAFPCVNDSRVLSRLAALTGLSLPAIPGADIVVRLLADPGLSRDTPTLIVGGGEGLTARVGALSGLTRVSQIRPPMGLLRDAAAFEATVRMVEASDARLVFLAVGSPQQEMLAAALKQNGRARGLGLCIGAGLDFMVGDLARAPGWMQGAGLEWLFRLLSEPRRLWRRYLLDGPQIFVIFLADLHRQGALPGQR